MKNRFRERALRRNLERGRRMLVEADTDDQRAAAADVIDHAWTALVKEGYETRPAHPETFEMPTSGINAWLVAVGAAMALLGTVGLVASLALDW